MDAKALLRGMGWTEGEGLGKSNQGISEAIKPKIQLDRNGLGMNPAASLVEPWWAKVFNQTAKNVTVGGEVDGKPSKKRRTKDEETAEDMTVAAELTRKRTKKDKKKKKPKLEAATEDESQATPESNSVNAHIASISKSLYLGSFTRGSTMQPGQNLSKSDQMESNPEDAKSDCRKTYLNPIDEALWKSCNGRTAHKGARYGVLKGKMARLIRQEEAMLSKTL